MLTLKGKRVWFGLGCVGLILLVIFVSIQVQHINEQKLIRPCNEFTFNSFQSERLSCGYTVIGKYRETLGRLIKTEVTKGEVYIYIYTGKDVLDKVYLGKISDKSLLAVIQSIKEPYFNSIVDNILEVQRLSPNEMVEYG